MLDPGVSYRILPREYHFSKWNRITVALYNILYVIDGGRSIVKESTGDSSWKYDRKINIRRFRMSK